jgi:replicative DNA helicase
VNPHNNEAERAVLGAALSAPYLIDELAEIVRAEDFYQPRHEAAWDAILAVHNRGDRPDALIVGREMGKPVDTPYLHEMTSVDALPVPAQAPAYARMVRDASLVRRILTATSDIRLRVEEATDADGAAEDARRILDEALSKTARTETGEDAATLADRTIDDLESDTDPGIETGWVDLDLVVNGLRAGQLIVVGARPSVGKSVIGANVAAAACKAGVGVHFASLEMTKGEVMRRMFSAHAQVDLSRLMNKQLTEGDWTKLSTKVSDVRSWPLHVDDTESQSLAQIRARAKRTARRLPLGLIVVDYLQLMAARDRRVPREQQVGEMSEGLKGLAKELGVPIMALAQLNRGPADRQDKRPQMSDLRESGRIEADADHVWLLHRQDLVDPKSMTGELEVIVAKNRNGQAGRTTTLAFQGHYSRAVSMARGYGQESA